MGFLRSTINNTGRIALVALAVKVSADSGIWSLKSEEGASIFSKFLSNVLPGTIVYREELPLSDDPARSARTFWNRNMNCAFSALCATGHNLNSSLRQLPSRLGLDK